jgi:hypothetical protein
LEEIMTEKVESGKPVPPVEPKPTTLPSAVNPPGAGGPMSGMGGTVKPDEPKLVPVDTPRIAKMKELSGKLGEILKKHGGSESDIPVTDGEYWRLKAEINALRSQPEPTT